MQIVDRAIKTRQGEGEVSLEYYGNTKNLPSFEQKSAEVKMKYM